jgi:redox-sensitive bicupin YhaK (pirin superfamily)
MMLDRVGAEVARATSIVRYAPGAGFPNHAHPGGEEILVLSGTFSEGDAHHGPGMYLRNPPGSRHQPASAEGALLFVKLGQMPVAETAPLRMDSNNPSLWRRQPGREACLLFSGVAEEVSLLRLDPGIRVPLRAGQEAELLLLEGGLALEGQDFARGSWMRFPATDLPDILAGGQGASVYLKTASPALAIAREA